MDYCLGDGAGGADIWSAEPTVDIDGDGVLDAIGLDLNGDARVDDALADLDGDGLADHAVHGRDGPAPAYFTDDEYYEKLDKELTFLADMRDEGVRRIAARTVGLSVESQQDLALKVDELRRKEHLDS